MGYPPSVFNKNSILKQTIKNSAWVESDPASRNWISKWEVSFYIEAQGKKLFRIFGNRSENDSGPRQRVVALRRTCNGEGADDSAEKSTRGGSPAPFLQIHSLHLTCSCKHSFTWCHWAPCKNYDHWSKFESGTFLCSNLFDSKLRPLPSKIWINNMLFTIKRNKDFSSCVRQHYHTATQWQPLEKGEPQTYFE